MSTQVTTPGDTPSIIYSSTQGPTGPQPTIKNINVGLREDFTPSGLNNWVMILGGTDDLILYDGNIGGASYLVISKDPFTADTESSITTFNSYMPPLDVAVGLHLSQRAVGQDAYFELVSTETPSTPIVQSYGVAIASIQQATTVLTIVTVVPHGLIVGDNIGINGVVEDTRLNYPSVNVASVLSSISFTVTAGDNAVITAIVSSGPFATGLVYVRPAMNYAYNGISQCYGNTSPSNASIYVREKGGTLFTSGILATTHATTVASTASAVMSTVAGGYAFAPTTEYRLNFQEDRIQFSDVAVDSLLAQTSRHLRTQAIPDPTVDYKLRFRLNNLKSLTIPGAVVVSATKSGTNVATVVTAIDHGLITGDWVNLIGQRDVTNFAFTATLLAVTVIDNVTFSVAYGATATATTYGGYVTKVHGSYLPVGFNQLAIQTASALSGLVYLTTAAVVGSLVVGDYVNLYGVIANLTGASLGIDGRYKVYNVFTTNLVLEPIYFGTNDGGGGLTDVATTDCGGAVIKRTDLRLSYARITDYTRERVEVASKPSGDLSSAVPVQGTVTLASGVVTTVGTVNLVTAVTTVGTVSTANLNTNNIIADTASAALTATATTAALTPTSGSLSFEYNVIVTAVTGTTPTLDTVIQESDDTGTSWYDVYHFPRITAAGQYRTPLIPATGNRIRISQTVAGTTPSFTRSINRIQSHTSALLKRQFFNRTIAPNTLSSSTGSFFIDGCKDINVVISMGAGQTTTPVLAIEGSVDGVDWYQVGLDISPTVSSNTFVQATNVLARFIRVRVKTAGVAATLNYIMIKGVE